MRDKFRITQTREIVHLTRLVVVVNVDQVGGVFDPPIRLLVRPMAPRRVDQLIRPSFICTVLVPASTTVWSRVSRDHG